MNHALLNKTFICSDTKQHTYTIVHSRLSMACQSTILPFLTKTEPYMVPAADLRHFWLWGLLFLIVFLLKRLFLTLQKSAPAQIQRPFGHDCRSQIKVYGSWIWWNCLKLNMKRNIASETPRSPLLWKSLFMFVSQTCRNPPSMLICLPRAEAGPYPPPAASLWLWGLLLLIVFLLTRLFLPAAKVPGMLPTIDRSRNMLIAIKSSRQWQVRHPWHPLMMHHSSNLWITHS